MPFIPMGDISSTNMNKAIRKFNNIKPHIKNDFFECDIFFSRIFSRDTDLLPQPFHKHSFYELHIPISGSATYLIEDHEACCTPGKIFIFSPDNLHHLIHSDNYLSITFGFSFVTPSSVATKSFIDGPCTEIDCSTDISNSILYMLHTLLDETIEDHYIFNNLFSVIIYDIFMRIPAFKNEFANNIDILNSGHFSDDARIRIAIQYISDNIAFPISADDVAGHLLLSSRQLNRILKNALNLSINQLINSIRIKVAKRYMATTDFSLSKIALMCGFNSPTHFNLTFKKATGVTPKLYRSTERAKKI